jgi:hypothetical protein
MLLYVKFSNYQKFQVTFKIRSICVPAVMKKCSLCVISLKFFVTDAYHAGILFWEWYATVSAVLKCTISISTAVYSYGKYTHFPDGGIL